MKNSFLGRFAGKGRHRHGGRRKGLAAPSPFASPARAARWCWWTAPNWWKRVRQEAEAGGAEAIAVMADLETYAGAAESVAKAQDRFGRIDIAIHNVGWHHLGAALRRV